MLRTFSGLLFCLLVSITSSAMASESIILDEADPPFMYNDNAKPSGVYSALIAEALKRAGIEAVLSTAPWKRAIAGLDSGENGVGGIYKNAERLKKYDYSDKLFDEVVVVYAPRAKIFSFSGLDSLKGKTVGILRGWTYGDDFDAAVKSGSVKTEETAGNEQNFAKLTIGRIDALLAIKESAEGTISTEKSLADKVQAFEPPLSTSPAFLAFSKTAGKMPTLDKFNAAIAGMRQDGSFTKIVAAAFAK
jgi:polar amino acid transport system substrate-binding protein